jgi:transposase
LKTVYMGADLHKSQVTTYYRDESGADRFERYETDEVGYGKLEKLIGELLERGTEVKLAVESTGNTRYFMVRMTRAGAQVQVINPLKFKVVTESVKKTDRHDAKLIAEFLERDMLPEARICSSESEELRRVLSVRTALVRTQVVLKNQCHGLLLSVGITSTREALSSSKKRLQLKTVLAEHQTAGSSVALLIDMIEQIAEQIKSVEKQLERVVAEDEVVKRIRSIPGAGLVIGSTIRAYIDDISRFSSAQKLCAYAGLVPWVQSSAEKTHYGSITKRGPEPLRTALVQLVLGMVRSRRTREYRIMGRYRRLKDQKGSGKSIIATARKLAVIIYHMLSEGKDFDTEKMLSLHLARVSEHMSRPRSA